MWVAFLTTLAACAPWPSALKAQAADVGELTGVVWRLVAIEPAGEDPVSPVDTAVPTLAFEAELEEEGRRRFHGFGGCNQFFGSYVAGADRALIIPSPIGATRMACPPAIDDVERAFFQALESVESYERDESGLRIRYEKGLLRFTASPQGERREPGG
jgi:heat shock protein HslJ